MTRQSDNGETSILRHAATTIQPSLRLKILTSTISTPYKDYGKRHQPALRD
ncbi:MAG: hypothetical protein J6I60_06490 [Bacteroidaceae bacterium]|nr:hypothetical protein [Bacteroidaceae bacterium]